MPAAVQGPVVPRDARLDDFDSSAEESDGEAQTGESGGNAPTGESAEHDEDELSKPPGDDPGVVLTTAWTPDGAPCATCGETVERRWRQDGALVCAECKTWAES